MKLSAENIKKDLNVELIRDFSNIEEGSIGTIIDFKFSELASLEDITISWKNGPTQAYPIDDSLETNIVSFLKIV